MTFIYTHTHTQSQNLEQILKYANGFYAFKDFTFYLFNYFICSKSLRPRPLRFLPKSSFLHTDKLKAGSWVTEFPDHLLGSFPPKHST